MLQEKATVMDGEKIRKTLTRITHEIIEKNRELDELVIVCIHRGGNAIGEIIQANIKRIEGVEIPLIYLQTKAYRDDVNKENLDLTLDVSESVDGKVVILVDDVLYTGRTVRAALDALNTLGRPRKVELAVLIDRGHRELPIRADFVGKNVPTAHKENVDVLIHKDMSGSHVIITERKKNG
ncbi:bifunctional pyr operon transcriptional regulator/uracil phosphoribosyltransferase PyrR [Clostridia bacterium]|nr:bifunctional pyr operon transcriptional regulator/uracil phosphoribosyltransferase PyrR [Clostridia bacterium]